MEMCRNMNTNINTEMSRVYSINASAQVNVRTMMNHVSELDVLKKEIDYGLRHTVTVNVNYSESFDFHAARPMKSPRVVSPNQSMSFHCSSYNHPD